MKKSAFRYLIYLVLFALPAMGVAADDLTQGDALYEKGGLEGYKQSIDSYLNALKSDPESYDLNWRLARSYRRYGEEAKRQGIEGWKDICADYGKIGMKYGEKAISLNNEGVEGHFYFGLSVGLYSDGVSIITALKEGLKGKTQSSFEKAYELDKTFDRSGPTVALGRFWAVLPWPLNDKKKAEKYLREGNKAAPGNIDGQLFLGEFLLDIGGEKNTAEAKALLQKVAQSDIKYYREKANGLLADID